MESAEDSIEDRATKIRRTALLPCLSSNRYEDAWTKLKEWASNQSTTSADIDENLLLVYFEHLSKSYAPSSLWTTYSMIKKQMLVSFYLFILDKL